MYRLVVLCLALIGCAGHPVATASYMRYLSTREYPILVSPDATFVKAELTDIQEAIDRWNHVLGVDTFILAPKRLQEDLSISGIVVQHSPLKDHIVGLWEQQVYKFGETMVWRSVVSIDYEKLYGKGIYTNTVVHELGHTMGIEHDEDDPTSIMYPTIFVFNQEITPRHLSHIRHLVRRP